MPRHFQHHPGADAQHQRPVAKQRMRRQQVQARHHQIASQPRRLDLRPPGQCRDHRQMLRLDQRHLPFAARHPAARRLRIVVALEPTGGNRPHRIGRDRLAPTLGPNINRLDPPRTGKAGRQVAQACFVRGGRRSTLFRTHASSRWAHHASPPTTLRQIRQASRILTNRGMGKVAFRCVMYRCRPDTPPFAQA